MPSRSHVGPEASRQELRGAEETDWGASWVQSHPQWQASCCHPRSSLAADGFGPGGGRRGPGGGQGGAEPGSLTLGQRGAG